MIRVAIILTLLLSMLDAINWILYLDINGLIKFLLALMAGIATGVMIGWLMFNERRFK